MENPKLTVKEQIVKTVVRSGNGGAVWVPRNWLGQEVVVILPEKPRLELKERVIHLLEPYLKGIISIGIYGSYARNEQTKDSDIDVLIITQDKKIELKEEKMDITSFTIDKLKTAVEKYPVMYYQMVQEAEPLINASILEELKSIKINKKSFKGYLKETKEHLKSNKELVELDKLNDGYLKSYSVLYSSILRLRGLFIIKCILKKDKFSNKKFKKWVMDFNLSNQEFEDCYKVYRLIRDNQEVKKLKIKIDTVEKILNILEKEADLLKEQVYGK